MQTSDGENGKSERSVKPLPRGVLEAIGVKAPKPESETAIELELMVAELNLKRERLKQVKTSIEVKEMYLAVQRGDFVPLEDARGLINKFTAEVFSTLRKTLPRQLAPKLVGLSQGEIAIVLKETIDKLFNRYREEPEERLNALRIRKARGRGQKAVARIYDNAGK
jgi:hypothetical protein